MNSITYYQKNAQNTIRSRETATALEINEVKKKKWQIGNLWKQVVIWALQTGLEIVSSVWKNLMIESRPEDWWHIYVF